MSVSASCNLFSLKSLPKIATIRSKTPVTSPCLRLVRNGSAPILRAQQPSLVVRAVEAGNGVSVADNVTAEAVATVEEVVTEVGGLKKKLVDSLSGTRMGLKASGESRAEIVGLVSQLEAENPTPAPTENLSLLDGKWFLVFTSSYSQQPPVLGLASQLVELLKVDEISQTITAEASVIQNSVTFVGPLATTSITANAKFEVISPKSIQIKFVEGIIGAPQLKDHVEIPNEAEFFGQHIDLSPLKGVITSVEDTYSTIAKTVSGQPPIKIPISDDNAKPWLLTYLDGEVRISKGDDGSVFVFVKEGSPLLMNYEF